MRDLIRAGAVGLATAGMGLLLALTQAGASLEERFGLTWLFALRGPVEPPDDVLVVGLDRRSAEELDLSEKIRDWPRDLYAELILRLSEDDASTIAFDLILEQARDPEQDRALVGAIAKAKRVVLFEALELQRQPVRPAAEASLSLLETQRLRPPIPAFAEAAAGLGPFPLPIVPDRVSQVWLFKPGAGGRPTLPAVTFQRHALQAYTPWRSLLTKVGAADAATLPEDAGALVKAADLRRMMIQLRQTFQADRSLAARLRSAIEANDLSSKERRLLRAMVDLYDGPDSRFLNFYGPAGQIQTTSLVDALKPDKSARRWQGVFVGQSELYEPHGDAFITVYSRDDGVKISGVEIAATAFANLLDGRLLAPSPYWFPAIAVVGLLIGAAAGLLPALWAVPACLGIALLYIAGAEFAFARNAVWLPTATPLLAALPFSLFVGLLLQYREARRARENLSKAIRYYLPDRIAARFADAPLDPLLLDEEAYAYCLITDASGFTRLAETMTSKQLKPYLESYLEILFKAVEIHGGRVTDSVGDGITAAFTAKAQDSTIAAKACQAALAIDREVDRFNNRHAPLRLPTRIGLNAGWVTLGHVGAAGRFTYTVVGDAVNTASRIEQLNKHLGTRILATKAVVEGVPDLALRPLGRFQLFGKEEVLEIVEMLTLAEARLKTQLIKNFEKAIVLLRQHNWVEANSLFQETAKDFDDIASRFFIEMCREINASRSSSIEASIICLDSK